MHKFTSRPIQITDENVLCEDGSVWSVDAGNELFTQIATWEKPKKKTVEKAIGGYTDEFEYFWAIWTDNIQNGSNKASSFKAHQKLSKEEKTALVYSVPLYAKTEPNNNHKYLKRCETYINQRHWESVVADAPKPPKEEVINRDVDLQGAF